MMDRYGGKMINDGEIDRGSVFVVFFATMGGAFVLGRAGPQITLINAARGAAASMMDIIDRVFSKILFQSEKLMSITEARNRRLFA